MTRLPLTFSFVVLLLATGCGVEPPGSEVLRIREGTLRLGASEVLPDFVPALQVDLPDDWPIARRRQSTQGWYHFEVEPRMGLMAQRCDSLSVKLALSREH